MIQYLFSIQPFWYFLLALFATWFLKQRSPNLCYVLWTFFLIKLMLPFGVYEGAIHFDFFKPEIFELASKDAIINASKSPIHESRNATAQQSIFSIVNSVAQNPVDDVLEKRDRFDNRSPFFFYPLNNPSISFFYYLCISFFLLAWTGLSLILLLVKSWSYYRFREKVKSWTVVLDGELYDHFLLCAKMVGLHHIPILRIAPQDYPVPFAMGLTQKSLTVVVPQSLMKTKDVKSLHIVLCHELVHIKKRDQYVNLIRFIGLICFHCHPLRILADRFVQGFQEITTDLITIKSLRVNKKEYVSVLLSSFMDLEKKRASLAHLSVPFLEGDISVVKRLFFIKRFELSRSPATRFLTYFIGLGLTSFFFINLSIYASYPYMSSLLLSEENGTYSFPDPVQTFPSILHDSIAKTRVYRDRLFVLEQRYGLFVYRIDPVEGPVLISKYTMDPMGDNHKEWWMDFAIDGDTVYIAVGDEAGTQTDKNRVEIVSIGNDFSLSKVGIIDGVHCSVLEAVDRRLYIGGDSIPDNPYFIEAYLWIYDVSNPQSPVLLNTDYYDSAPVDIEVNDDGRSLFVLVDEQFFYYPDRETLISPDIVDLGLTTSYVKCVDSDKVLVFGQNVDSVISSFGTFLILMTRLNDNTFQVSDIASLEIVIAHQFLGINDPFIFDRALFTTFLGYGTTVFDASTNKIEMLSFSDRKYVSAFPYQDRIIVLHPETNVFNANDFLLGSSRVVSWNQQ